MFFYAKGLVRQAQGKKVHVIIKITFFKSAGMQIFLEINLI